MTESKVIDIQYYAIFREQRGVSRETITTGAQTAIQLYDELCKKYGFKLPPHVVKVAVNDEFVGWDAEIKSKDSIVFVPPVAGG